MTTFDQEFGQDFGGELCPEALKIAQAFDDPSAPPVKQMDITAARRNHALEAYDIPIACENTRVEDRQLTVGKRKLRVRIYTPAGDGPFPILVFAHGGCWTFCSIDSHDSLCHYYAHHAQCVVVSVDYALAPEAPYPHGLNDIHDAIVWCFEHVDKINGDASRIAVAGDSAGGNLSAAVAQRLQHHPKLRLSLQLLLYPICDASKLKGGSLDRYASGYFLTRDVLTWTTSLYTSGSVEPQHPGISPCYGTVTLKLAPALFIIAECDILRDQAIDYARILRTAGIEVQCNYYRGVPHAFMAMAGALDLGQAALQDSALYLKLTFSKNTAKCNALT